MAQRLMKMKENGIVYNLITPVNGILTPSGIGNNILGNCFYLLIHCHHYQWPVLIWLSLWRLRLIYCLFSLKCSESVLYVSFNSKFSIDLR